MPPPEMIEDYGHTYGSHSEMSVVPEMIEDYRDTYPEVTGVLPADDTFVGFHGGILSRFGKAVMRLFLFPGDGTYYPSDYGVVDPSGTINSQPAIQAAINAAANAGGGIVSLPSAAALRINKPLVVPGGVILKGNYAKLYPYFCGYCVYVIGAHTPITLGTPLCTGSPGSLICGPGDSPKVSLQSDRFMDLSNWNIFSVEGFIKTDASPVTGAVLYSGVEIAGNVHTGFALFALDDGALRIVWDNVNYDTASGVLPNNTTKFFSINFDGTNVKLYLGTPGGSATQVLSFVAGTSTVPCYGGGIEGMWLGSIASSGFGGTSSLPDGRPFKGLIDGIHFSFIVRRTGTFTAPTSQPGIDNGTLLIPIVSTDGMFLVGQSGHYTRLDYGASYSYFLPSLTEVDSQDSRIENLFCTQGYSSSGICVYDGVATHLTGIKTHPNNWNGIVLLGTTYASTIIDCAAHAMAFGWVQAGQSMSTKLLGLDATGATPFYAFGPVGGFYGGVYLNPTNNTRVGLWISQTYSVSFYWLQFDDEGATTDNLIASVLIDNAVVGLNGGLIQHQHTDKPAIQCSRTGSVKCSSDLWIAVIDGTAEVVKFTNAPVQNAVFQGTLFTGNYTNLTTTPQYADYTVNHQATLSMSGNHTGQLTADCEYLLISTSANGQILRGLQPGKHKGIINSGSNTLVLSDQDAGAYAANYRFVTSDGTDLTLEPGNMALVVRDNVSNRNRIFLLNGTSSTPTVDGAFVTSGGDYFVTSGGDYLAFAP